MKGRVVALVNVDAGRCQASPSFTSLPLIGARAAVLRLLTELYREKSDGSNIWGWKFFSHARHITQKSCNNLFIDFTPRMFTQFNDQLRQQCMTSVKSWNDVTQSSSRRTNPTCTRTMLVKALTDVVTNYPWDMPDIASPVRRSRAPVKQENATTTAARNVVYIFSEHPVACPAWARFHGVTTPAEPDVQRLLQESLLPASLVEYLERYNIRLVFVDISGTHFGSAEPRASSVCYGLCKWFSQTIADLSSCASSIALSELLYGSGSAVTVLPLDAAPPPPPCTAWPLVADADDDITFHPLQFDDVILCQLFLVPYTFDCSLCPTHVLDVRIVGLVQLSDIAVVPMDTLACFGLAGTARGLSATFQQLMTSLTGLGLCLAVTLAVSNSSQLRCGLLLPYTGSIGLLRLYDDCDGGGGLVPMADKASLPAAMDGDCARPTAVSNECETSIPATQSGPKAQSMVPPADNITRSNDISSDVTKGNVITDDVTGRNAHSVHTSAFIDGRSHCMLPSSQSGFTECGAAVTASAGHATESMLAGDCSRAAEVCGAATTPTCRRSPRKRKHSSSSSQHVAPAPSATPPRSASSSSRAGLKRKRSAHLVTPEQHGHTPVSLQSTQRASPGSATSRSRTSPGQRRRLASNAAVHGFSPSVVERLGSTAAAAYQQVADRHCHLFGFDDATDTVHPASLMAVPPFSSWASAYPSSNGLASLLDGLDSTPPESLVESDATANLHDLCKSLLEVSQSPRARSTAKEGQSLTANQHNQQPGGGDGMATAMPVGQHPESMAFQDLMENGVQDIPLRKGLSKWLKITVDGMDAEDSSTVIEQLLQKEVLFKPKQLREFLAASEAEHRASWLQGQIFIRFQLLELYPSLQEDKFTTELVSFLSSIGVSFGPRTLVTFMENVLVEGYLAGHRSLLIELYDELDVEPCEALGASASSSPTDDMLRQPLMSAVAAPTRETRMDEGERPSLKRYSTEDTSRRQIAVPARKKSRRNSSRSSKSIKADKDLSRRIRGVSEGGEVKSSKAALPAAATAAASKPSGLRGKEGVRRQLFSAPCVQLTTATLLQSSLSPRKVRQSPRKLQSEVLVDESPVKGSLCAPNRVRRTTFSIADTPVKDVVQAKERELELRRRLSKGKISVAETPPKKSFYSTSDNKRSQRLLRRSKTISDLLAGGSAGDSSMTSSVSQMAVSNTSLLSLQDPFSPTAEKKQAVSSLMTTTRVSLSSASEKPWLPRFKSDSQVRQRLSTVEGSPDVFSEKVLTESEDDGRIVCESPPSPPPAVSRSLFTPTKSKARLSASSKPFLSVSATPQIEGIDQLLTSPLVSTSNSATPKSFL